MPLTPSDRQSASRSPLRSHPYSNQNQPPRPPLRQKQNSRSLRSTSTTTASTVAREFIASKIRRAAAALGIENVKAEHIDAIIACVNGQGSIVTLPTGFGKSLCFQLVPQALNDTVIVICPLIALAADQVRFPFTIHFSTFLNFE